MSKGIDISTPEKLDACLAWLIDSAVIPCAKGRVALYEAIRRELRQTTAAHAQLEVKR